MDLGQSCLQAGRARSNTMQESTDGMFVQSLRTQESSGLDNVSFLGTCRYYWLMQNVNSCLYTSQFLAWS